MKLNLAKLMSRFGTRRPNLRRPARPYQRGQKLYLEQFEARVVPSVVFSNSGSRVVADSGGNIIQHPDVDLVFWGDGWNHNSGPTLRTQLNTAVGNLMNSPYLSPLIQYRGIGIGRFFSSQTITSSTPPNPFSDGQVDQFLQANISAGVVSDFRADNQVLYIVVPQPGTVNVDPNTFGAHYSDRLGFLGPRFHYGWTINRSNDTVNFLTKVISHEIVEAATDPEPNFPNGAAFWVPSTNDEISDGEAQNHSVFLNGVLVQSFLSQSRHAYIVPTMSNQEFLVSASGALTVNGDQLANHNDTIFVDMRNGGVWVYLNGDAAQFEPGAISSIVINSGTGNDNVIIDHTPVGVPVAVNVGTGVDTVTVGAGSLNNQSTVTVNGQPGGQTTLHIQDYSTNTSEIYTVTNTFVSRTSGGVGIINYSNIQNLAVDVGSVAETLNVLSTPANVATTINANTGRDTITVGAPNLRNAGPVTVNGRLGGQATLIVDDHGTTTSETYTVTNSSVSRTSGGVGIVNYSGIQNLAVNVGTATETVNVVSTRTNVATAINANTGTDTVNVSTSSRNLSDIQGTLSINGRTGSATDLVLGDSANSLSQTITLNPAVISRPGAAAINFSSIRSLSFNGGNGNNTYNVNGTTAFVQTTLNTGAGNNTVNLENTNRPLTVNESSAGFDIDLVNVSPSARNLNNIQGVVSINGHNGFDALRVNDQNNAAAQRYTLEAASISRSGAAVINFNRISNVTLSGSAAADTYHVGTMNVFAAFTLNTGGGGNTVDVETASFDGLTLNTSAGGDTVVLGGGSHTLDLIGPVVVNDASGTSAVVVDDSGFGGAEDYAVSANTVTITRSASFGLSYSGIGSLTLNGGQGGDTFDLDTTSAATTVNGGTGSNCFHVSPSTQYLAGSIGGALTLNGSGADVLDFFDANDPNSETYSFDAVPSTLTLGSTGGTIATFSGMGSIYVITNGISTPDDQSGTVIFDPAGGPPCAPGGRPSRFTDAAVSQRVRGDFDSAVQSFEVHAAASSVHSRSAARSHDPLSLVDAAFLLGEF